MVAEAEEHVHDLVAEVNAEDEAKAAAQDAQERARRDGPSI
jgi:hypothetical protein